MFTAALQMNLNDSDDWDSLPQDLWVAILDRFVLMNCSRELRMFQKSDVFQIGNRPMLGVEMFS